MKLKLILLVFAIIFPLHALALNFGDLRVYSYLHEPLKIEIPILDLDGIPARAIEASIGTKEDYITANLQYEPMVSVLSFKINEQKPGSVVLQLTSDAKIDVSYFELLVNVTWPEGKIHHVFTVLLDSMYKNSAPEDNKLPLTEVLSISKGQIAAEGTWFKQNVENQNPILLSKQYGPTVLHETIWNIAKQYKFNQFTLPQVVLSIIGLNPDAFEAGNLNGLKAASILQIPESEKIADIPPLPAAREVEAHDIAWGNHQLTQHVIAPPYFQISQPLRSDLPSIPQLQSINPKIVEGKTEENNNKFSNLLVYVKKLEKNNTKLMVKLKTAILQNKELNKKIEKLNHKFAIMQNFNNNYFQEMWPYFISFLGCISLSFILWQNRKSLKLRNYNKPSFLSD